MSLAGDRPAPVRRAIEQAHRKKTQAVGKFGTIPTKAIIESIKKQQKPVCQLFESVSFE
jgi:hypothetical protein